jgi:DNA-binding MarR family transcriptional regulator
VEQHEGARRLARGRPDAVDQPVVAARLDCVSNDTAVPPARDLSSEELAAWGGFLRAHAELTRALDAELVEAHGLPLSSYEVLLRLARAPRGRLRMSDLAESVLLSRSGLTRLVDRLEKAGLVERQECRSDQRGFFAVITEQGRMLFREAAATHLEGVRRLFLAELSEDERRLLGELWARLASR